MVDAIGFFAAFASRTHPFFMARGPSLPSFFVFSLEVV